jgi:hypothetical protein
MNSWGDPCIFRVPCGIADAFREAASWTAGTSVEEAWAIALCGKYGTVDVMDVLSKNPQLLPPWILCSARTLKVKFLHWRRMWVGVCIEVFECYVLVQLLLGKPLLILALLCSGGRCNVAVRCIAGDSFDHRKCKTIFVFQSCFTLNQQG